MAQHRYTFVVEHTTKTPMTFGKSITVSGSITLRSLSDCGNEKPICTLDRGPLGTEIV